MRLKVWKSLHFKINSRHLLKFKDKLRLSVSKSRWLSLLIGSSPSKSLWNLKHVPCLVQLPLHNSDKAQCSWCLSPSTRKLTAWAIIQWWMTLNKIKLNRSKSQESSLITSLRIIKGASVPTQSSKRAKKVKSQLSMSLEWISHSSQILANKIKRRLVRINPYYSNLPILKLLFQSLILGNSELRLLSVLKPPTIIILNRANPHKQAFKTSSWLRSMNTHSPGERPH